MGSFSDYLEKEILDHILGNSAYSAPATVYIGLWTAALADAHNGSQTGEVSSGSYVRKAVANNATNWPPASGTTATKSNGTTITFVTATAGWGTVTHFAILDAASAGNIIGWGQLTEAKIIGNGDTASFEIGDLDVTLD